MKTYRRKRQQKLFAGLLGMIAIINLLFFLIMYRPVRAEYSNLQDSIEKSGSDIQLRKEKIVRLEKLNAQLETSAQDRHRLMTRHFIPKETGWSQIVAKLDAMVQRAGVKNTRKNYSIAEAPQYGLYSVKIRLPVTGSYSNIVDFMKEIENAETFLIIDSIDVRGSDTPGMQDVSMNLNLEAFFYQ